MFFFEVFKLPKKFQNKSFKILMVGEIDPNDHTNPKEKIKDKILGSSRGHRGHGVNFRISYFLIKSIVTRVAKIALDVTKIEVPPAELIPEYLIILNPFIISKILLEFPYGV